MSEGFLRRYQVLPGRTHPMMNASGSGGFILHVIKMCVRRLKLLLDSLTPAIAMMMRRRCRLCSTGIARRRSWIVKRHPHRPLQTKQMMTTRKQPLFRQWTSRRRTFICGHCRVKRQRCVCACITILCTRNITSDLVTKVLYRCPMSVRVMKV